jgi:hypothetical protein
VIGEDLEKFRICGTAFAEAARGAGEETPFVVPCEIPGTGYGLEVGVSYLFGKFHLD